MVDSVISKTSFDNLFKRKRHNTLLRGADNNQINRAKKIIERYDNDVRIKAIKYYSEGLSYKEIIIRLSQEYTKVPKIETLRLWMKRMPQLMKGSVLEYKQAELVLKSTERVMKDFEWLHNINRELIDKWYKDPDTYSRELILSIREFHSQLITAMKKLNMIKEDIHYNIDARSIVQMNEFQVATTKYLEQLVKEGKIEIKDDILRKLLSL